MRRAVAILAALLCACSGNGRTALQSNLARVLAATDTQDAWPCALTPEATRRRVSTGSLRADARTAYFQIADAARGSSDPAVITSLAAADFALGETAAALSGASMALAVDPTFAPAWNLIADLNCQQSLSSESPLQLRVAALDAAMRSVEFAPGDRAAWLRVGALSDALFVASDADAAWQRVRELPPQAAAATRHERPVSAALKRWQQLRARLSDLSTNVSVSDETVAGSAQQVREFLLNELLGTWGAEISAGRSSSARAAGRFQSLAAALARVTGDVQLRRCGEQLTVASPKQRALAAAYTSFGTAMTLYAADRGPESQSAIADSSKRLALLGSPCAGWAKAQHSLLLSQAQASAEAVAESGEAVRDALANGFHSLAGRAAWTNGLAQLQRGRPELALASYRTALAEFTHAKEVDNVLALNSVTADALRRMGEHALGWVRLSQPIIRLDEVVTLRRRYNFLLNASIFSADAGYARAAIAFQNASLDAAKEMALAGNETEALSRRAHLFSQVGSTSLAMADLANARRRATAIPAVSTRTYQTAWLDRYEGEALLPKDPKAAASQLTETLVDFFRREEPNELPSIYLDRAKARRAQNDVRGAEGELIAGIAAADTVRRALVKDRFRVTYLDSVWPLHDELTSLRVAAGEPDRALRLSLEMRGLIAADHRASGQDDLHVSPPEGTLVLYFVCLENQLLVWHFDGSGRRFASVKVGREALTRLVVAYRALIEDRKSIEDLGRASAALARAVLPDAIPSSVRRIVVVPDGPLQELPFDALIEPASGHFLVERATVSYALSPFAPSESVRSRPSASPALLIRPESPLAATRGELAGASAELAEILRLYPRAVALEGAAATPAALRRSLAGRSVVHFAGHSQANAREPWASALLMAADAEHPDGVLAADEISSWDLPAIGLVVLASCESAVGGQYRGEGVVSLARPFLVAGAATVVGSLWNVDDRATARLLSLFHERYSLSGDASDAMREARLRLLKSTNPADQMPYAWAGFVPINGARR